MEEKHILDSVKSSDLRTISVEHHLTTKHTWGVVLKKACKHLIAANTLRLGETVNPTKNAVPKTWDQNRTGSRPNLEIKMTAAIPPQAITTWVAEWRREKKQGKYRVRRSTFVNCYQTSVESSFVVTHQLLVLSILISKHHSRNK